MEKISKPKQKITNDHGEDHIYVFEPQAREAINAALTINRPLLVRGEPGVGKSQLAKAAAAALDRTYIPFVVNAGTESQDLLWSFDAVARLADAQIEGALYKLKDKNKNKDIDLHEQVRKDLALEKYIKPAPLWAALNWQSAEEQYEKTHNKESSPLPHYFNTENALTNGVVVLIDEIDKADSSVPNGLLEVLGANRFHPDGVEQAVEAKGKFKPLIIITTNEERLLPDAFIRRCLSVTLGLPKDREQQIQYLVKHAKPNFTDLDVEIDKADKGETTGQTILQATAEMVLDDRTQADSNNLHPLPGQAEYFDLLRGIEARLGETSRENIRELINQLSLFTSKKHPDLYINKDQ